MAKNSNNQQNVQQSTPADPAANSTPVQEQPQVMSPAELSPVPQEQSVAVRDQIPMQVVDLTAGQLPDLDQATEVPLDLMADYWTPEAKGESKRVYFDCIKERLVRDQQDPNVVFPLTCAYFYEKVAGQPARTISNGSKRLVGLLESLQIPRGTALQITYLGKKKNATNQHSSDNWSVRPLLITIQ
jgi:hypothetical protein